MTTVYEEEKECAVCGEVSRHMVIASTSTVGSPDLDMRPPEVARSTMDMWIQSCPSCGYCAPDISERIEKASEIVYSDFYRRQLSNPIFPELANAFLCYSLIQERAGNYADAGWASIHAAWVCDDAGLDGAARRCRRRAVALLQKAKENGQRFAKKPGAEEAIMVDLLRRSGQFELALEICNEGLSKKPEKVIEDILRF